MIVCLEGPSAVGKTTLAAALASRAGAAVVPELVADASPPIAASAAWFVERHAERWQRARALADAAPLVVLDGDPFKGLWYHWTFADEGWSGVDVVAPLHRAQLAQGALAFPDLYVVLTASAAELRARRAGDPTRTRRHHEKHLRLIEPQRRYFTALGAAAPGRVLWPDTSVRERLVDEVLAAIARLPHDRPDDGRVLDHVVDWLRARGPVDGSPDAPPT